jgi:ankyrin repeat protein
VGTQNVKFLEIKEQYECIKWSYYQEEGQTCLHIACSKGDENIIRTLYLARASPSVMDKEARCEKIGFIFLAFQPCFYRTPMHLAAEKGHTSAVEFLAGNSNGTFALVLFSEN